MTNGPLHIPGYDLLRQLGAGGASTVYLARQHALDRKVAIKVMHRARDASSVEARQLQRRFLQEGRTMAALAHRNIVEVYDIVSNDDISCIAMEYLSGGALTDRIRAGSSLSDAVNIIGQIASALEFAHDHAVVHRDLKPANILFRDLETPVLTDFGIALHCDPALTRLTQAGIMVGTPTYMSPDQINSQELDGRSDLYSLGILFYELLTGRPPFSGASPIAIMMEHLTQPLPRLPSEFSMLQPTFDRMLAKNKDDRFINLSDFNLTLKAQMVKN